MRVPNRIFPERLASATHNHITSSPGKGVSQISKVKEQELKRMNLNVPLELHNSFKSVTASQGLNMTDVLLDIEHTLTEQRSVLDDAHRKIHAVTKGLEKPAR